MIRTIRNNESGMVLVMALMGIVVLMLLSVGIVTRGSSHAISAEQQIDRIRSEQLSFGAYAKAYTDLASGGTITTLPPEDLDGKVFTTTVTVGGATGPNGTTTLTIDTPYPN